MSANSIALMKAQRLIFREVRRTVSLHAIRLSLSTEPDQYEVRFRYPNPRDAGVTHSLVPRLTLTESEFKAAEAWLDDRYGKGIRPW